MTASSCWSGPRSASSGCPGRAGTSDTAGAQPGELIQAVVAIDTFDGPLDGLTVRADDGTNSVEIKAPPP